MNRFKKKSVPYRNSESTLCIIPARGGSKRIPKKNIQKINGSPLLAYTVRAAVTAECFSDIYVSSDDDAILEIASEYGAAIDNRSKSLATDTIGAKAVVYEFINRESNIGRWDNVAMCLPTCPFRTSVDIINAMSIFLNGKDNCPRLVGLTKYCFPPQLSFKKKNETGVVEMCRPDFFQGITHTQIVEERFHPNGSIYIATINAFNEKKSFWAEQMLSYIMPEEKSFDIDYPYQLEMAEFFAKNFGYTPEKTVNSAK